MSSNAEPGISSGFAWLAETKKIQYTERTSILFGICNLWSLSMYNELFWLNSMNCWVRILCFITFLSLDLYVLKVVRDLPCDPNIYVSWSTSEIMVRLAPLNMFKPSSGFFLIVRRRCFFCGYPLLYCPVCSFQPCDHLLGKDWPLGSLVYDVPLSFCHFPIRCLG